VSLSLFSGTSLMTILACRVTILACRVTILACRVTILACRMKLVGSSNDRINLTIFKRLLIHYKIHSIVLVMDLTSKMNKK
jgi:hypothetical protein